MCDRKRINPRRSLQARLQKLPSLGSDLTHQEDFEMWLLLLSGHWVPVFSLLEISHFASPLRGRLQAHSSQPALRKVFDLRIDKIFRKISAQNLG